MVDCGRLEICCARKRTGGSNPSLSARMQVSLRLQLAGLTHDGMVLSPIKGLRVVRVETPVALRRRLLAAVLSLPLLAQAAGLGRMNVQSFLGQPLRAEIEIVSVQPGEESSLEARLASRSAFAQAGIEFSPALSGIRFTIDKRDGRPIVVVSTREPANEPFVNLLVELQWATGLLMREYTVLLDPSGYEGPKPARMAAAPVAPPSAPTAEAKPEPRSTPAEQFKPPASAAPAAPASPPAAPTGQTYEVKKGDTLGELALQYRPQGVTFNQMLIALQRATESAFINNNINLVRAGRILNIPDAEAAAAVDVQDANRLVKAQHADFAEYRSRLGIAVAAAPAGPQAVEQRAAGQITPKTEPPKHAPPKDQLKLSKADAANPGAAVTRAAREDDLAAHARALEEAQSRVAELEKNASDLQQLLEIRNRQLAQMQQKASAAVPAPPKPASASSSVAAKPKPQPMAPPPPRAEPSLLDEFLDDPVALGGLGVMVLLLGGYGVYAWQRKRIRKQISG